MAYYYPYDQNPEEQDELPLSVPPVVLQYNWAPLYEASNSHSYPTPLPNFDPHRIFFPFSPTVQPWAVPIDPVPVAESAHEYANMGMSQPEASQHPPVR
ncbi:hypothetical protein EKO27_g9219 [Xylaria grammica]|uniref:Uncharacterized protein n=1 Tax=Xylaria grammica TaxID=363999 RepID=A0A439CUQ9_9PEZI|nr:hypothetical protein EKO27_g9219 [Xylaria grammica]